MNNATAPMSQRFSLATIGDVMGAVTIDFNSPRAIQQRRTFGCSSTTRKVLYLLVKIGLVHCRYTSNERGDRRVEFALLPAVTDSDDFELAANVYGDEKEEVI